MVSGALLHALRIGLDSAYNNDEIDQARDHHDNADARADTYAISNAVINLPSQQAQQGIEKKRLRESRGRFSISDRLQIHIAIHAFADHFETVFPEFLFADVDVESGSQGSGIS